MVAVQSTLRFQLGRALIIAGFVLLAVFTGILRWLIGKEAIPGHPVVVELTLLLGLSVTTVSMLLGTVILLRKLRSAAGSVSLIDLAFVALGLLVGGVGVLIVSDLVFALVAAYYGDSAA
jgi:hypothetical protein